MADYRIVVKTGGAEKAGTDAKVHITLIGSRANSGERQLDSSGNDFERHSTGLFSISTRDPLGDLTKVRIRHDNAGRRPGWFLDYITVHEELSDKMWYFPCNRWLAVDEDDHLIDRTLDKR
jgi:hypothetical protein